MAVTPRSRSEVIGSGTSPTLAEPAGAAAGDVFVALALSDVGGAIAQPAGWTSKYSGTQGGFAFVVSIITRGTSAPSLTWTVTGTVYREVYIVALKGVGVIFLDSQSASGSTGNSAGHNPDPPPTTAIAAASLAIAGGVNFGGNNGLPGWTVSTGYAAQTTNASGADGFVESKTLSAAGNEDPSALGNVIAGLQDWWDGFTMTFTDTPPLPIAWVSQ